MCVCVYICVYVCVRVCVCVRVRVYVRLCNLQVAYYKACVVQVAPRADHYLLMGLREYKGKC